MTPKEHPKRTSQVLQDIIDNSQNGSISLGRFTDKLGDRGFALAILIFALPNSLPIPGIPGFSTITGLPITFIALQMVVGRQTIWLPDRIARKEFSMDVLKRLLNKAMPGVIKLEKYLTPRWDWVTSRFAERFLGLLFVVLSLIIALPIPGGNFFPGLAMSLIALGMLEKDGLFVSCAVGFSLMAIALMVGVIKLFFQALFKWAGF